MQGPTTAREPHRREISPFPLCPRLAASTFERIAKAHPSIAHLPH